jgi:thiol:disulfide interchange protein
MNSINPYSAPQSDISAPLVLDSQFGDLDAKSFNKLYYRSCNVTAFAVLLLVAIVFLATAIFGPRYSNAIPKYALIGACVFYLITSIGLFKRTSWGRIMGIIVSIISLISITLGTIIGIVGLFAFVKAPNLFGENKILHKDLKAEFKLRKKLKKLS